MRVRVAYCGLPLALAAVAVPVAARAESGEAEQPTGGPQPYVDRLIDGGGLQPLLAESEERTSGMKGNVRSLAVELSGSRIAPKSRVSGVDNSGFDNRQEEAGISISGRYQTDNYGLFGIDAELRRGTGRRQLGGDGSSSSTSGSITLSNRDFPLGNGWLADSAAGMVTSVAIPLLRQQPRFYVPTSPLLGGTVTFRSYDGSGKLAGVENPESRASVNLSVGEPGLLGGLHLADFSGLSGIAVSAGGQAELSPRLVAGFQAIGVENARDPYALIFRGTSSTSGNSGRISTQAALGSIGYSVGAFHLQANAIWSHLSGKGLGSATDGFGLAASGNSATAAGGWLDASYRTGRTAHTGGVYYFGPDLAWGTSAIVNNAYGAYYRFSAASQRWRWTASIDAVDSVDGRSASGVLANADVRRQLTFNTAIGVNSTLRITNRHTSSQVLAYVDFQNPLGSTRTEAGWSRDPSSRFYHLGWNQNWSLPAWLPSGSRLSTQLTFDRRLQAASAPYGVDRNAKDRTHSFGAAVNAGASPFGGISFDATVAFNSDASTSSSSIYGPVDATGGVLGVLSSQQGRAFSATLSATARLSSNWSLSGSFTDSRSNLLSRYGLSGLASSPLGYTASELAEVQKSSFRLVAGYLTLRYAISAGRPKGAMGRREFPVGGTGVVAGRVYLDGNANGQREPSEAGVVGIVVILDGIQSVRTDEAGVYRFDRVADGRHRISVNADALPLPWSIRSDDIAGSNGSFTASVDVGVRSTTVLDIAARRD